MGHCLATFKKDGDNSDHNVEFTGGNVHLITTEESWGQKLEEAKTGGKTVIANFSAGWCDPCRVIAPFYIELSEKHTSLMFLTIDVDELTEFSTTWDIKATPTFIFLKDGKQIDKLVGGNKTELHNKMTALLDSESESSHKQTSVKPSLFKKDGDNSEYNVEFTGGYVHLITTEESWGQKLEEAKTGGKTVIANFSAGWCDPCRVIAPFYIELSEKHTSLMFLTIDVDELTEFSTTWDIKATPTFIFLKDGKQIDKLVGGNKTELQNKMTALLDSESESSHKQTFQT